MDLIDPFGRTIRDLRISVTDRCNFRCTYCMPEEGMQWLPRSEVLTFEEIERLARVFVERFEVREGCAYVRLADATEEPLDLTTLRMDDDGVLRCRVKANAFDARFSRHAQLAVAPHLREGEPPVIELGGVRYPIRS